MSEDVFSQAAQCCCVYHGADALRGVLNTLELEEPRITKVGRWSIFDLVGNDRVEAGTDDIAESDSINKSLLFFLGKGGEKLSSGREDDVERDVLQSFEIPACCQFISVGILAHW